MPNYSRGAFNLGNAVMSNWIYNFERNHPKKNITPPPPEPPKDIDYLVIGGGITGTYLARRLSEQFPNSKVLLIEKSNRIGGRYNSLYLGYDPVTNPYNTALEYGGMRIFPSIQPRITELIAILGLKKVAVPYVVPNNIFSGRTKTFLNSNLFPNTNQVYFLDPLEQNENIFNTINVNTYDIFEKYGESPNPLYENRVKVYKNPEFSSLSFRSEITQGTISISTEDYNRFANITGYTSFYWGDFNFTTMSFENTALNTFDDTQYFVETGIQRVPEKCIEAFSDLTFKQLKNKRYSSNKMVLMESELVKFSNQNNNASVTISNNGETTTFNVGKLFITVPIDNVYSIEGFPDEYYNRFLRGMSRSNLFKIFLYYETNWWSNLGFTVGRCTTDMPIDQVWFYNNNTLLVYAINQSAEFWAPQLPYPVQNDLVNTDPSKHTFIEYLMKFVKKVFENYTDVPLPDKIGWEFWANGVYFWNSFDFNTFEKKSIYDISNDMINIYGENGNVFYLNNDISLNQGWGEGSIEIVDQFLEDKYNMPDILHMDNNNERKTL